MSNMKEIYKKQLAYVKDIAEDIVRQGASKEVIAHAKEYAHIENEYGEFFRVNWGEAYAYVDVDNNGTPTGTIGWENDEMGVINSTSYEGTIADLERMTCEEILQKSGYGGCYAEEMREGKEYSLIYQPYAEPCLK